MLLVLTQCSTVKKDNSIYLEVGVAQTAINPDSGAFIAGDKNNRRFTGVHDSLYVKVVAISNDHNSMALVTFDCIGMLYPVLEEIRHAVSKELPMEELDPNQIVMTSTHTHSGPDVVGIWGPDQTTSGVDSTYMEKVVLATSKAIKKAWLNKKKATTYYGQGTFGEDWVYNISDSLNLDRSLNVLQFKDTEGRSIGTLTNFACHPTFMDGNNNEVSADYVAGLYQTLDDSIGGVNFFLQGAIGGWVQPEYEEKTFDSALKRGAELGDKVLSIMENGKRLDSATLDFKSAKIKLPVSNVGFQQLTALGVIDREMQDGVETEIALFKIGSAMFVTHPGETTPTHSKLSKKLMKTDGPKFVLGLGMDALGYILTPDFYEEEPVVKHSGYLQSMSIDPEAGSLMLETIEKLVQH